MTNLRRGEVPSLQAGGLTFPLDCKYYLYHPLSRQRTINSEELEKFYKNLLKTKKARHEFGWAKHKFVVGVFR